MGYDVRSYEIFPTYESSDLLFPALLGFLALLLGRLALHQRQHTFVPQHMLHGQEGGGGGHRRWPSQRNTSPTDMTGSLGELGRNLT